MFLKRHDISHNLARMRAIGQSVYHWYAGMFRHFQQRGLLKGSDHDQIHIAAQNPRRVSDGFPMSKLHICT